MPSLEGWFGSAAGSPVALRTLYLWARAGVGWFHTATSKQGSDEQPNCAQCRGQSGGTRALLLLCEHQGLFPISPGERALPLVWMCSD